MEKFNLENIGLVLGILVILIGLYGLLSQKNLLKMVIGFAIFDTGIHILMVSIGYIRNRKAPILDEAVNSANAVNELVDPVPQALVLTAIVIGLGITALMLSYVLRMHQKKNSLEINQFKDLKW